jgi:hypothetical protein
MAEGCELDVSREALPMLAAVNYRAKADATVKPSSSRS